LVGLLGGDIACVSVGIVVVGIVVVGIVWRGLIRGLIRQRLIGLSGDRYSGGLRYNVGSSTTNDNNNDDGDNHYDYDRNDDGSNQCR